MFSRKLAVGLLSCIVFAACSDQTTTAPTAADGHEISARKARTGPLVKNLTNLAVVDRATGLPGSFTGTLTITRFASNAAGDLLAVGTIDGTTTLSNGVTRTTAGPLDFSNLVVTPAGQRCRILHLDLGPIFFDLLGLQLTTSPITLDLTAVAGAGNLLGNLLCAVAHLLDQNPLSAAIQNLLNQINAILGAI